MRMVVDGCADAEPRTEATSTATTTTHPTHGTTCGLQTGKKATIQHKNRIHTKILTFVLFHLYLLPDRLQVTLFGKGSAVRGIRAKHGCYVCRAASLGPRHGFPRSRVGLAWEWGVRPSPLFIQARKRKQGISSRPPISPGSRRGLLLVGHTSPERQRRDSLLAGQPAASSIVAA